MGNKMITVKKGPGQPSKEQDDWKLNLVPRDERNNETGG